MRYHQQRTGRHAFDDRVMWTLRRGYGVPMVYVEAYARVLLLLGLRADGSGRRTGPGWSKKQPTYLFPTPHPCHPTPTKHACSAVMVSLLRSLPLGAKDAAVHDRPGSHAAANPRRRQRPGRCNRHFLIPKRKYEKGRTKAKSHTLHTYA